MQAACFEGWVRRRAVRRAFVEAFLAACSLVGGALELLATFSITYLILHFSLYWWLPHTHATSVRVSLAFVVFLFLLNPWASRRPKPALPDGRDDLPGEGFPPKLSALLRYADADTYVKPLPPSNLRTVAYALCTGPRVLLGTGAHVHAAYCLARVDVHTCAEVIALLFGSEHKMPLAAVRSRYRGTDFTRTLCDLRYLGGVLFLVKPPVGLLLGSRARREIKKELGLPVG